MLPRPRGPNPRLAIIAVAVVLLIVFSRSLCSLVIDYSWWQEMGQVSTWIRMSLFRYLPVFGAWIICFAVLWIAHARGMKFAGTGLGEHRIYAAASTLALLLISLIVAVSSIDGWTVARFAGGRGLESTWHHPLFSPPLGFYFFDLPFFFIFIHFLPGTPFVRAVVFFLARPCLPPTPRFPPPA